jgi:hypothetical protein
MCWCSLVHGGDLLPYHSSTDTRHALRLAPTPLHTCCVHPSLSTTHERFVPPQRLVCMDLSKVIHLVPTPRYVQNSFMVCMMGSRHTGHVGVLVLISCSAHASHTHW